MSGESSIAYHLFLYRQLLGRRNVRPLKLKRRKNKLTNEIVAYTWNNITTFDKDGLNNLMDIILYNEMLQYIIDENTPRKPGGKQVTFL